MFFSVCDALFRSVVLLGLALAPFMAPLEAAPSATMTEACARLSVAAAVTAIILAAVRWSARRSPLAALLGMVTWLAIVVFAVLFSHDDGPVMKAVPFAAPLAWLMLAAFAHAALGRSLTLAHMRWAGAVAIVIVGIASYAAGHGRVTSRAARYQAALLADPGAESPAFAYAAMLNAEKRSNEAAAVLRACADARPLACACVAGATLAALDRANHKEALARLDGAAPTCRAKEPVGMRAEALAGLGLGDDALREADRALIADPEDKYALFAKGRALQLAGNSTLARHFVEQSIAHGRGVQPRLLLGLLLYQANELDAAEVEFRAVIASEPENAPANYDLALVAHRKNRYRDAREGYLRALKLDPTYLDARYNLVLLTHDAGADQEASHHLDELRKAAPNDARIDGLARALSARPAASDAGAAN